MPKYLILSPTVYEAKPLFNKFGIGGTPKTGACAESQNGEITVLATGIGCAASSTRVREAVKRLSPQVVVLAGYCGACREDLKNGDFIFEAENGDMKSLALRHGGTESKIDSVKKIAGTAEKLALGKAGYAGVDMEGDIFREAVRKENDKIEFAHFRWISDSLESNIPPEFFQSAIDMGSGELRLSVVKIALQILKNPALPARLSRFGREIRPAKKRYDFEISAIAEELIAQ